MTDLLAPAHQPAHDTVTDPDDGAEAELVDVLVVGAGISGIGAARHLTHQAPGRRLVVLEGRDTFGGTWEVNRYPGVRSDSDMFTFGYSFKPWLANELATAEEIRKYLGEVIEENDLGRHIRYGHRVTAARWSSSSRLWYVDVTRSDTGERVRFAARFLWMCQGYYRHDEGYTPDWPGLERFRGEVVHPLTWPEQLDHHGKRVVVVGSGATAATLVPALAQGGAGHVTMVQRSPSYYVLSPRSHEVVEALRSVDTPDEWVHEIARRLMLKQGRELAEQIAADPAATSAWFVDQVRQALPEGYDVERHFTPTYPVWRQRLCRLPEGDLLAAIREGRVTMVTGHISEVTETGLRMDDGTEVEADVLVTATGFHLSVMGGIPFTVDGDQVDWSRTVTYHGTMFTGVPNLAYVFGYLRASWTLRVDLVSDLVCRLLRRMEERGATVVVPQLRPEDHDMPLRPWNDPDDFDPGYMMRSLHLVPRQGDRFPWRGTDVGYHEEVEVLPAVDLDDGTLVYQ